MADPNPRVRHWWGWVRHILRDGAAYLNRYTLRAQGPSGTNPWRLYLHEFLTGDGPDFHNHPSRWSLSVVLSGSYTEEILQPPCAWHRDHAPGSRGYPDYDFCIGGECVVRRRVRWFNWIPADKYHRITQLHPRRPGGAVWTLFMAGPLTGRGWGFYVAGVGHVPVGPDK